MTAIILTTAGVITLITVAFCIVGGMADTRLEDELDSAFARARYGFDERGKDGSDTSSGAVGDVIHGSEL